MDSVSASDSSGFREAMKWYMDAALIYHGIIGLSY